MTGGKGPQPNVPPGELKRISEAGGKQMRGKEEDDKGYVTGTLCAWMQVSEKNGSFFSFCLCFS